MNSIKDTTIIIATTCEAKREQSLLRAIESVRRQQECASLEVVVNGKQVSEQLFTSLRNLPQLRVHRLEQPSYPAALAYGRSLVSTEFFGFIDDDDELLGGAISQRLALLIADPSIDFVATNGYRRTKNGDELIVKNAQDIAHDPLLALTTGNWLASCGGLFRTRTVTHDFFDASVNGSEWTYLAFRLCQSGRTVRFLNLPTFMVNESPESLSRSFRYPLKELVMIEKMIDLDPPPYLSKKLEDARTRLFHEVADIHRLSGELIPAWKFHLKSLKFAPLTYMWFTRKLLLMPFFNDLSRHENHS